MKSVRQLLHDFAINYQIESRESRNKCIDTALEELRTWVEGHRKINDVRKPNPVTGWNSAIDKIAEEMK